MLSHQAIRELFLQVIFFRVFYFLLTVTVLKKFDGDLQRKLAVRYVSCFHAFVTGTMSVLSFIALPEQLNKPDQTFNPVTYYLILFSISYFTHDTIDMIIYGEGIKYREYIMHHVFMLSCGAMVMRMPYLLPVAMVALVAEVNTVFIHLRLILKFYGYGSDSKQFRTNQFLNIASFMPCRQLPPLWIAWFSLFYESENVNLITRVIFLACTIFITVHNYRIFKRMLTVDGYIGQKKPAPAVHRVASDDLSDIIEEPEDGSVETSTFNPPACMKVQKCS